MQKYIKKTLFIRIFRHLCTKDLEKMEKHCFLTILRNVVQKARKRYFFISCELRTKCLEKSEKNTDLSHFCRTSFKKHKICSFNAFFAIFVLSVSINVEKRCFLTLFVGRLEAQKTLFFPFFSNFVQSV